MLLALNTNLNIKVSKGGLQEMPIRHQICYTGCFGSNYVKKKEKKLENSLQSSPEDAWCYMLLQASIIVMFQWDIRFGVVDRAYYILK